MAEIVAFLLHNLSGRRGFVIELAICELIFLLPAKCRKAAPVLIPLSYVVYFAFGFLCPIIPIPYFAPIVICLLIFLVSIGLQFACCKIPVKRLLFNSSAAYVLQNFALNSKEMFRLIFKWTGWTRLLCETAIVLAVYALCYVIFARRSQKKSTDVNIAWITLISFCAILVANIMYTMSMWEGLFGSFYVKLISAICCLLALLFQFSVFHGEELAGEKRVVEQLLLSEQKQHKMSQENIDLINIKCHDLKKQINMLKKSVNNKEMDEIFSDVENAVMLYGDAVKTGNDNLDLILAEKIFYCKKYNIRIELIADGALLNFMAPADVYSLFGNALDNAIESVMKTDESRRVISIYVNRKGDLVCIKVSNYCRDKIDFAGDLPVSTKKDKSYHGFGVRSMKYVTEKYKGNLVFDIENSIFSANIIIPLPKEN